MKNEVKIPITSCQQCPNFKITGTSSTDGFDRGDDWHCKLADQRIASFVEWHEHPPIPAWCPYRPQNKKKQAP